MFNNKISRISDTIVFIIVFLASAALAIFCPIILVRVYGVCLAVFTGIILYDYFNHKLYL